MVREACILYLVRSLVAAQRRSPPPPPLLPKGRGVEKKDSSIFSEEDESEWNFESTRACVDWK